MYQLRRKCFREKLFTDIKKKKTPHTHTHRIGFNTFRNIGIEFLKKKIITPTRISRGSPNPFSYSLPV